MAYALHGEGPPLVCTAWWVSHLEDDWADPGYQRFFESLGRHHTVLRYDRPGAGLSDRTRERFDLETEVGVLRSLVDEVGFERMSVLGVSCAGPPSVRLALQIPERVERLVFFGSYLRGSDVGTPEVRNAVQALVRASWGMGSRALTDLFVPDLDAEARERLGEVQRSSASAEMASRLLGLTYAAEVEAEAPKVHVSSLVLHRRGDRAIPFSAGRELAASLPNARLESLEGAAHVPWFGDVDAALDAILSFTRPGVAGRETSEDGRPAEDRSLVREGDLWRLTWEGKSVHLPHARGLEDLAILLSRPGEEVHAAILWSGEGAQLSVGGSDPVVDDEALADYRERLRELDGELEEADAMNQLGRAEALRREREMLAAELRSAVGLGGRKRQHKELSERARKAVSSRIRAVLKKIFEVHETLGEHLKSSLVTGTYCCYSPGDAEGDAAIWAVR